MAAQAAQQQQSAQDSELSLARRLRQAEAAQAAASEAAGQAMTQARLSDAAAAAAKQALQDTQRALHEANAQLGSERQRCAQLQVKAWAADIHSSSSTSTTCSIDDSGRTHTEYWYQ